MNEESNKPSAYVHANTTPEDKKIIVDPLISLLNKLYKENKVLRKKLNLSLEDEIKEAA